MSRQRKIESAPDAPLSVSTPPKCIFDINDIQAFRKFETINQDTVEVVFEVAGTDGAFYGEFSSQSEAVAQARRLAKMPRDKRYDYER